MPIVKSSSIHWNALFHNLCLHWITAGPCTQRNHFRTHWCFRVSTLWLGTSQRRRHLINDLKYLFKNWKIKTHTVFSISYKDTFEIVTWVMFLFSGLTERQLRCWLSWQTYRWTNSGRWQIRWPNTEREKIKTELNTQCHNNFTKWPKQCIQHRKGMWTRKDRALKRARS